MNTPQTPSLAPHTLGAYIGSRVFLWDKPEGRQYGTLKGFDGYRTCYVCPEGLNRFTYEYPIYEKVGYGVANLRLQLRRMEGMAEAEKAEIVSLIFPAFARVDEFSAAAPFESLRRGGLPTRAIDALRARGFDCGGYDSEGNWHPSLIEAGLADEVLKSTNSAPN